jgi:hypothetical protein
LPAALAAVLLLAATVDQRPAGPPRLLAEVGARHTSDGYLGPFVAALPVTLALTPADHRCDAHHMIF